MLALVGTLAHRIQVARELFRAATEILAQAKADDDWPELRVALVAWIAAGDRLAELEREEDIEKDSNCELPH